MFLVQFASGLEKISSLTNLSAHSLLMMFYYSSLSNIYCWRNFHMMYDNQKISWADDLFIIDICDKQVHDHDLVFVIERLSW